MRIRENIEFGTTIALWSQCADRFLSQGYKESITFKKKVELISKIKDIKGVDLYGDWDVNPANIDSVKKTLADYGLKTFILTANVASLHEFGKGAVTSPVEKYRKLAWEKIKEAIDMAETLDCNMINLWLGQDGYDYPLQIDYIWGWNKIIDTVKEAADFAQGKNIKRALE